MIVVEVRGAVVSYGARPALRGVDFAVSGGEMVAILGANGSGKTTLIRAVLGLTALQAGTVSLFGVPSTSRAIRAQWRRVGYVPQRLGVGPGVPATVAEVVGSGRLSRRRLFAPTTATDRAAISVALEDVGLTEHAAAPVSSLSGGQQQRTLIARALAGRPELLVLDEPTAGVDAPSQVEFARTLRNFVDRGGTAILVTHELGPLEPLITRTIVLHNGVIVERAGADHAHHYPTGTPASIWSPA